MAKLISAKFREKYANQQLILPHAGEVKFGEDGTVEIEDDKVENVIASTKDSITLIKVEEVATNETAQMSEYEEELSKLPVTSLLELVKESNIKEAPEKLATYTSKKLIKLLLEEVKNEPKDEDASKGKNVELETQEEQPKKEEKGGLFGFGKK